MYVSQIYYKNDFTVDNIQIWINFYVPYSYRD